MKHLFVDGPKHGQFIDVPTDLTRYLTAVRTDWKKPDYSIDHGRVMFTTFKYTKRRFFIGKARVVEVFCPEYMYDHIAFEKFSEIAFDLLYEKMNEVNNG